MSELEWDLDLFWNPFYSIFITFLMNLFDHLVIVTYDPIIKG